MITNVANPYSINVIAVVGFFALMVFTISHVLATAPPIIGESNIEASQVIMQQSYSGIIAWVTDHDIKITDAFGVSRTFTIDSNTHILVNGFPVGSATYENLRVLDHVRITTLKNGPDERAQVIIAQ